MEGGEEGEGEELVAEAGPFLRTWPPSCRREGREEKKAPLTPSLRLRGVQRRDCLSCYTVLDVGADDGQST